MKKLLFDNLDGFLGKALAEAWERQGGCVIDASCRGGVSSALSDISSPHGVVFTESVIDEATLLSKAEDDPEQAVVFTESLHQQTIEFLANCRAATQAMMPVKQGNVLALCVDDVAARVLGLPQSPIINQARAAATKSLSKEYGRMGISYNTVVCQPSREMVEKSTWRASRDAMKVYSLRYSPVETSDYISFLLSMFDGSTIVNGGLICLGNGVMEMGA
ncbi:MAG: hypothetical protein L3J57_15615 [Desulfuromusa sp.]|nr:hypothetical protein [Desulfuromusa sp.]